MKSFIVLQLCLCLFSLKLVRGQYYDQQNDWSWIQMQDKSYLAPENEDQFHEHHHSSIYSNIEPLENIFNEEIYNKANLFKIGEAYAPAKPQEPRNEVIVDDIYEQPSEKSDLPSHVAAGFGEVINAPPESEESTPNTPQMFDTFSVEKSETFIGPENKVEDIEEIVMHIVDSQDCNYPNITGPVVLDEDLVLHHGEEPNEKKINAEEKGEEEKIVEELEHEEVQSGDGSLPTENSHQNKDAEELEEVSVISP